MRNFVDKWEESNKANTEGLPYIDDGERKLFYRFTPSKTNPIGAPLLVILHGHGTKAATRFQREGWNVLSPIDHFGYEGKGSWWLGENGDFFVKDLLQNLISQISKKYNSEENIYIYGSSMGGYGAILHGILCSARAVYANVPQIKLLGTTYSDRSMKRYFAPIFSSNIPMENNLENFFSDYEDVEKFPIFYLCENVVSGERVQYENYLKEHTDSFVNKCKKYKLKFHLELLPKSGHDKNYGLGEVMDKFNRFSPPIVSKLDNDKKSIIASENLNLKSNEINDTLTTYVNNLNDLDKKRFLLITFKPNFCDSYNFRPRKDLTEFKINLPMNWDIDPFHDNNWLFQLHAFRLLDTEIVEYMSSKNLKKLERTLDVVLDWKRDIIDNKENFDFNRESNKNSFAWHDMATGLRAIKIAFLFQELLKFEPNNSFVKHKNELYKLVNLHIEALSIQRLAAGNHAIFQVHGLMMLLRLFPNDFNDIAILKQKTINNMSELFYKQFFKEGIHKENSSSYHYFIIDTFEKVLSEEIYPNVDEIFEILELAKKNCGYMHYPNFESLMMGDTDYKIVKQGKEEELEEGLTHFKESGYTYIYEDNGNPSMLFFDTAFLNRAHRHADFFNVLLYEYGKNILVDAGKYSYNKTSPIRQYCISTRAHNTVLIGNQDYQLDRKHFFTSRLTRKEKKEKYYHLTASNYYDYFEVSHDRHIFYKPREFLLVIDVLNSNEIKNFKQVFHLHQDLELLEYGNCIKSHIIDEVVMNIQMKSLNMNKNEVYSNITFSKGTNSDIEGYRALGHNEVVENYVLVNELESEHVVFGSIFSFNKQRDFKLVSTEEKKLEIIFDSYKEIIGR